MSNLKLFLTSSCLILFLLTAFWIRSYAHPSVSLWIKFVSVLSYGLGLAGVLLLPLDLSLGGHRNHDEIELFWNLAYWGTFFLAYIALPFLREYLISGHFTFAKRMKEAFRESLRYMLLLCFSTVIFVVLLAIHLKTLHLLPVLMALGNTYGLLLVVVLLGYGLIDIPRLLLRWAKPEDELNRIYLLATKADELLYEAVWELQDVEEEIDTKLNQQDIIKSIKESDEVKHCAEHLLKIMKSTSKLPSLLQSRRTKNIRTNTSIIKRKGLESNQGSKSPQFTRIKRSDSSSDFGKMDAHNKHGNDKVDELAALHARLKFSRINIDNAMANFHELMDMYKVFTHLRDLDNRPSVGLLSYTTSHGKIVLRGIIYRSLALVCVGLSGIILWSECTMLLPYNFSPLGLLFKEQSDCELRTSKGASRIFFESLSLLIPLIYISACVYWSLLKATMFTSFKLNTNRLTSAMGLIFIAQNFIRMQFPLGYNFLLMFNYSDDCDSTAFSLLMSNMETVPFFGTGFSLYAPLFVILFSMSTYYNFYPRLLSWIGLEHEDAIILSLKESQNDFDEVKEKLKSGEAFLRQQALREAEEQEKAVSLMVEEGDIELYSDNFV